MGNRVAAMATTLPNGFQLLLVHRLSRLLSCPPKWSFYHIISTTTIDDAERIDGSDIQFDWT
jgi:hypothetical protein